MTCLVSLGIQLVLLPAPLLHLSLHRADLGLERFLLFLTRLDVLFQLIHLRLKRQVQTALECPSSRVPVAQVDLLLPQRV